MDLDLIMTSSSRKNLTCARCQCYLSHFPIFVLPNGKNICGRCPQPPNSPLNTNYQMVCKRLKFPCIYEEEGCSKKLLPEEVPKHEEVCRFRSSCPLECQWRGHRSKILSHCRSQHSRVFLRNFEFHLGTKSDERVNFLEYNSVLLQIHWKYDSEKSSLSFSIENISGPKQKKYFCELTFRSSLKISHVWCDTKDTKPTELVFDTKSWSPFCKVLEVEPLVDEKKLYKIQCSGCSEFALPPMYLHQNKVKCSECKAKAGSKAKYSKSVDLDKIATSLNYPCKFWPYCTFASQPKLMKTHIKTCEYAEQNCYLYRRCKCNWRGAQHNHLEHIQKSHKSFLFELKNGCVTCFLSSPSANHIFDDCYVGIISGYERLFKYKIIFKDRFCVKLKLLGKPRETFQFQLRLFGSDVNHCLIVEEMCSSGNVSCNFRYEEIHDVVGSIGLSVRLKIDM